MVLTAPEQKQICSAATAMADDAAAVRVEDFVSSVLNLNAVQRTAVFPSPDPNKQLETIVAYLTKHRENILRKDCMIPTFVVDKNKRGLYEVCGLTHYLKAKKEKPDFVSRLSQRRKISDALKKIEKGHRLEAVAAAILDAHVSKGSATQKGSDQGIDAIGWHDLLPISNVFVDGPLTTQDFVPGEKTFILASCKAVESGGVKTLNPAHVRELVGNWVIQRSNSSIWKSHGLKMLSPMQMVLVTTYRLSETAKLECRELGVQVWSLPELVYWICKLGPTDLFDPVKGFVPAEFGKWWKKYDNVPLRLSPS